MLKTLWERGINIAKDPEIFKAINEWVVEKQQRIKYISGKFHALGITSTTVQ